jgi:hypothetical protein
MTKLKNVVDVQGLTTNEKPKQVLQKRFSTVLEDKLFTLKNKKSWEKEKI